MSAEARSMGAALALLCLACWASVASAHELALDQLMVWPDRNQGALRGELTLDPELTRSKSTAPTPEHSRRLIELLGRELVVSFDGQRIQPDYRVRELWAAGGATLGDLVIFTAPLPDTAQELRIGTGPGLANLIVSVQVANGRGADTHSWLLGADDESPPYALADAAGSGWTRGGPEAFEAAARARRHDASAADDATTRDGAPSPVDASAPYPGGSLAVRFVRLGIEHIVPGGLDHVLFVAGLVLGSGRRYRRVVLSLSLFTLAHSLSLALSHFGVLVLPARWIEPAIALSIAALGVSNLRSSPEAPPRPSRHALVFGFGLIHGLGFASALSSIAFEHGQVLLALAAFNVGVELGQMAVVAMLALAGLLVQRSRLGRRYVLPVGSMALVAAGLALTVDRLALAPAAAAALPALETLR